MIQNLSQGRRRKMSPLVLQSQEMERLVDTVQHLSAEHSLVLVPAGLTNAAALPLVEPGSKRSGHEPNPSRQSQGVQPIQVNTAMTALTMVPSATNTPLLRHRVHQSSFTG